MKLNSKYFDSIRVKPDQDRLLRNQHPECEWDGCTSPGTNKAPKGRNHDGEYHLYCMAHVREYNKSYNYFSGMKDQDIGDYQKDARTGHRPTWSMGSNPAAYSRGDDPAHPGSSFKDAYGIFSKDGIDQSPKRRPIRNAERKALTALGLDETAQAADVKTQYKVLVKRHHPDANGGGKAAEEKLREIIQAYDYLKRAGFC
jgi:hypothetical protein